MRRAMGRRGRGGEGGKGRGIANLFQFRKLLLQVVKLLACVVELRKEGRGEGGGGKNNKRYDLHRVSAARGPPVPIPAFGWARIAARNACERDHDTIFEGRRRGTKRMGERGSGGGRGGLY